MALDLDKFKNNIQGKAGEIPIPKKDDPAKEEKLSKEYTHYSRIGFEDSVWKAMKMRKYTFDESYIDQVNSAMKMYLNIK